MRFWGSVPVLSVQMTVTAPIVSQACILRTRLLVFSIRRMDIASDSVIDIGSPSGTAMTMMATETMKICSTCCEMVSQSLSSSPPAKIAFPSITQKISAERRMPSRPIRRERRVS